MIESDQLTHIGPAPGNSISAAELPGLVRSAFTQPIDYPPLASATVPGDNLVLAVEYGVPHPAELIEGTLAAARDSGVEPSDTKLLLSHEYANESALMEALARVANSNGVDMLLHKPDDEDSQSVVGVAKSGLPLRFDRVLGYADVVLPIGVCSSETDDEGNQAMFGSIFPAFSDRETINRHHAPIATESKVIHSERRNEVDEAGWILGVGMTLKAVPNSEGNIAAIYAGDPKAVSRASTQEYKRIWSCHVESKHQLAIAHITGDASQQTWECIGRAIRIATRAVEPGGRIAICSELAQRPGLSLQKLAGWEGATSLERELMRDRFADSSTALALCRALQNGPVYFQSQLDPAVVESVGLVPLANDAELSRLVEKSDSSVVLDGAQRLLPTAE